jgi:hypothetical protein
MDLLIKFIIAFIKGMTDIDLNNLLESSGKLLGKEVRKLLIKAVKEGDVEPLKSTLLENAQEATQLASLIFGASLAQLASSIDKSESPIEIYLEILNLISKQIHKLGRPIVLTGFLHTSKCFSYWKVDTDDVKSLELFEEDKHTGYIIPKMFNPEITIFKIEPDEETLIGVNKAIEKNPRSSVSDLLNAEGITVNVIREYEIEFYPSGKASIDPQTIPSLMQSLPIAIEAQMSFMSDLKENAHAALSRLSRM